MNKEFKLVINHDSEIIENSDDFLRHIITYTTSRKLSLSGLGIMRIDFKHFDDILHPFYKINLRENMLSSLKYIPLHIIKLKLDHNRLTDISFLKNNINLISLNVSYNEFLQLDHDVFDNLINLEKLKISGIHLKSINKSLFKNLNKLKYLCLAGNDITYIDIDALPTSLLFLNVTYNKLKSKSFLEPLTNLKEIYTNNNLFE